MVVGVVLASGVLLGQTLPALAIGPMAAKNQWPTRDFLPPIASINPKLQDIQKTQAETDNSVETVAFTAVSSPVLKTTPKVERLATDLSSQIKNEQLEGVLEIQKKVDSADLEALWKATVEKNPVIRFSLEKLATPADLQSKQSSKFLNKTLSLLIQGSTMAATMIPGASAGVGAYRNMGTMAVGNALQNLTSGKTQMTPGSLSATEQIQLAGLIDELKIKLIHNYQDYKSTLQALAESHEVTLKNNNLYSKALSSKNDLAVMAAGTAYYQALMTETSLRQKAKLYRLQLERLAGTETVSTLQLAVQVPDNVTASNTGAIGPQASLSSESPIGPELPPATTGRPVSDSAKTASPIEGLPEALEIGPHLSQENMEAVGPPMPKSVAKQMQQAATKAKAASARNVPAPIPDKILGHKENQ